MSPTLDEILGASPLQEIRAGAQQVLAHPWCCEDDSGPLDCRAGVKALKLIVKLVESLSTS